MKLRHKETGEIIDLPDYLPDYHDAKEIARVFKLADAPVEETAVPPGIVCLKTFDGDVIQVDKITNTKSHFPYDKLIRIHLNLPPFTYVEQKDKSVVWSVVVNGMEWSVDQRVQGHIIRKFEWNRHSGWWAVTDGIYAINLEKINPDSGHKENKILSFWHNHTSHKRHETIFAFNSRVINMGFQSWIRRMIIN